MNLTGNTTMRQIAAIGAVIALVGTAGCVGLLSDDSTQGEATKNTIEAPENASLEVWHIQYENDNGNTNEIRVTSHGMVCYAENTNTGAITQGCVQDAELAQHYLDQAGIDAIVDDPTEVEINTNDSDTETVYIGGE